MLWDFLVLDTGTHNVSLSRERQSWAEKACKELHIAEPRDFFRPKSNERFLADENKKVLYCVIPKNACTSWKTVMALNSGRISREMLREQPYLIHNPIAIETAGLKFLKDYSSEEVRQKLTDYYKFVIYRHPLERLASAWHNKFVQQRWYSQKYFKEVYARYGERIGGTTLVPFTGFLTALVSTDRSLSGFRLDKHWTDQYLMCRSCFIKYDHIAKMETLDNDSKELFSLYNITGLPTLNPGMSNSSNVKRLNAWLPKPNVKQAFADLPIAVREKIRAKLNNDMSILGYSWDGYE